VGGIHGADLIHAAFIIADHPDIRVHTPYQLIYVIGKAVVVIDQ
jgi:hypothetical protein